MGQFTDTPFPSVLTLLEALQEAGTPVPEDLLSAVKQLKKRVQDALQVDEEQLEETLETFFPEVWQLRIAALPFLTKLEMKKVFHTIELDLEEVAKNIPPLKATVEHLKFGLDLTAKLVHSMLANKPHFSQNVTDLGAIDTLNYHDMMAQISATENEQATRFISFLHGSLMMELLLFALHQITEGDPTPEKALCHELQYLSADAVRQYAAGLGIDHTQLPWHQSPVSDFQKFLLAGPVANAEQLLFIKEKRAQFNTWK